MLVIVPLTGHGGLLSTARFAGMPAAGLALHDADGDIAEKQAYLTVEGHGYR